MESLIKTKRAFDTGYAFTKLSTSRAEARTMAMAYIMGIAYKIGGIGSQK